MSKKQILLEAEKLQIQLDSAGFQNLSDVLLEEFAKESESENLDLWNSMQMQRKFDEDLENC